MINTLYNELIITISNDLKLNELIELDKLVRTMYSDLLYSHINHLHRNVSEYVYGLKAGTILKGVDLLRLLNLKVVMDIYIIVR